MPGKNLHLFMSPIEHATRLFKEARALLDLQVFDEVHVLGRSGAGLPEYAVHETGLRIHRATTIGSRLDLRSRRPAIRRALAMLSLVQYSLAACRLSHNLQANYVTCHQPLLLPVGWVAGRLARAGLVYSPHELEVERAGLGRFGRKLAGVMERVFIGRCTAVVVVSDSIADWYRKRHPDTDVFVVRAIPEKSVPLKSAPDRRACVRSEHGIDGEALVFVYQGLLSPLRGIPTLLRTFVELGESYHLLLMGYGECEDQIRDVASVCPRVHLQPAVPMRDILSYTAAADVGLVVLPDPVPKSYAESLPNKFFEYLNAGLPVIVSPNLEVMTDLVQQNGLGWVSPAEALGALIRGMQRPDVDNLKSPVARFAATNSWATERQTYLHVYR